MARKLKHETSTRYPTICRQWSERRRAWIWGFRLPVSDGPNTKYLHVHEFATQDEARAVVEKLREEQKQTRYGLKPLINRPTLQELIERRLPSIARRNEQTRARRVLYTWLAILDPLVKLAADYTPIGDYRSGIRIEEIQTPHIRQFLERRQADGQTAASINRGLNIVAATLHAAGEFFPQLLQWKTPKIPRPKAVKSRRERIISQDEYSRIVAHLRRPADAVDGRRPQDQRNAWQARVRVAQIFEFAMLTGCRHGEIVKLRWADIDWERNKFLVYQTKTGEYKEIPLTASLMAVLEERKPADGAFVFTSGGNIYPKFYRILRDACLALGISYGKNLEDGLILHDARHTVTTRLVEAGLDLDTIGSITGHRAKELIAHYSHRSPGSVARAAEALERIGGSLRKASEPETDREQDTKKENDPA